MFLYIYTMRPVIYLLLTIMVDSGCSSVSRGYRLPDFTYNGKYHNHLILERRPKYGDGQRDGCAAMNEFSLAVKLLSGNLYSAEVRDAQSGEAVMARIVVQFEGGKVLDSVTDALGKLSFDKVTDMHNIVASALGYRTMIIDLSNFKDL